MIRTERIVIRIFRNTTIVTPVPKYIKSHYHSLINLGNHSIADLEQFNRYRSRLLVEDSFSTIKLSFFLQQDFLCGAYSKANITELIFARSEGGLYVAKEIQKNRQYKKRKK